MSPLLHFVNNQKVFSRYRGSLPRSSRKNNLFHFVVQIEDFSCRQVHYQTKLSIHRFIYRYFGSSQNLNKNNYSLSILTFSIFLSLIYLDEVIQVHGQCSLRGTLHVQLHPGVNFTHGSSSPLSMVKLIFLYTCSIEVKSHSYPYFSHVLKTGAKLTLGLIRLDFNVQRQILFHPALISIFYRSNACVNLLLKAMYQCFIKSCTFEFITINVL